MRHLHAAGVGRELGVAIGRPRGAAAGVVGDEGDVRVVRLECIKRRLRRQIVARVDGSVPAGVDRRRVRARREVRVLPGVMGDVIAQHDQKPRRVRVVGEMRRDLVPVRDDVRVRLEEDAVERLRQVAAAGGAQRVDRGLDRGRVARQAGDELVRVVAQPTEGRDRVILEVDDREARAWDRGLDPVDDLDRVGLCVRNRRTHTCGRVHRDDDVRFRGQGVEMQTLRRLPGSTRGKCHGDGGRLEAVGRLAPRRTEREQGEAQHTHLSSPSPQHDPVTSPFRRTSTAANLRLPKTMSTLSTDNACNLRESDE